MHVSGVFQQWTCAGKWHWDVSTEKKGLMQNCNINATNMSLLLKI
jgi:hypothetical protein